jgi:molybdate transport system permease protein
MVLSAALALYLLFWAFLIAATAGFTSPAQVAAIWLRPEIVHAGLLSLLSCTLAAGLALLIAVPLGYLMARQPIPGKSWLDAALDIPIVLPPMVVGLCLLIFFQTPMGHAIETLLPMTYTVGGVVLAQWTVAAAFAIRSMRSCFDQLSPRPEQIALTLGASDFQAFRLVALPAARRGMFAAFCIAWARSMGEFGPILVFAGATRMKTEVLPTTVWLELSVGNLDAAVAVSLAMIALSALILVAVRRSGQQL